MTIKTPLWKVTMFKIGYMSSDLSHVTDTNGKVIGKATVVASWPMPKTCYVSSRQYQVECVVDGKRYTGRTFGGGMSWRGKAKKEGKR